MILFLYIHFIFFVWQATHEACSPAQLLQLLQPPRYPEIDASALAAQAHARVLVFVKTLSRAKCALREAASKETQERAVLQRNLVVGAAVSIALICIIVVVRNRRCGLLACAAAASAAAVAATALNIAEVPCNKGIACSFSK
jgi:hypothetical protein